MTPDAAAAIAREIADAPHWELLEFTAVDEGDAPTQRLLDELADCDCMISRTPTDRCWAIELPATWDEFLAMQSKSHPKQLRQMERRVLESPRAAWRLVEASDAFGDAWSTLVDLHQRRRQSLGEPGCFASPMWAAFHWDVAQQLLRQGTLRLSTLQFDGRPIAAEYHFTRCYVCMLSRYDNNCIITVLRSKTQSKTVTPMTSRLFQQIRIAHRSGSSRASQL